MKTDTGNLLAALPSDLEKEAFEEIVKNETLTIERIVSRGHTSPESGWYDQDNSEWVMVVAGEAMVAFEDGREVRLAAGDYLNIPAHARHRVAWTKPGVETVWLAVHYRTE